MYSNQYFTNNPIPTQSLSNCNNFHPLQPSQYQPNSISNQCINLNPNIYNGNTIITSQYPQWVQKEYMRRLQRQFEELNTIEDPKIHHWSNIYPRTNNNTNKKNDTNLNNTKVTCLQILDYIKPTDTNKISENVNKKFEMVSNDNDMDECEHKLYEIESEEDELYDNADNIQSPKYDENNETIQQQNIQNGYQNHLNNNYSNNSNTNLSYSQQYHQAMQTYYAQQAQAHAQAQAYQTQLLLQQQQQQAYLMQQQQQQPSQMQNRQQYIYYQPSNYSFGV